MLNREDARAPREARPDRTLPADPLLRHGYGGQLEAAAEAFLISAFEHGGRGPLGEEGVPPVLVSAALHILTRTAWTQPTDEQIKAAMYLSAPRPADPHPGDRRAA